MSLINANNWPALCYHAGLDDKLRRRNQERFTRDNSAIMIATVAFGMGINKPNIRFILHAHLPNSIESYYQEIGRAGRDGSSADCLLLYSRSDAMLHRHFIDEGAKSERASREARLNALLRFSETGDCRRKALLAYFGEALEEPCGHCDNCVRPLVAGGSIEVTIEARQFLSCVKATGQRFGAAHIIAILRGSRAMRVLERKHDRLIFFGAGKNHSADEWRDLAHEFVRLDLLEREPEFGTLHLTRKGRIVLNGKEKIVASLGTDPGPYPEGSPR